MSAASVISLALSGSAVILATSAAIAAVLTRRAADRWRDRALMAEHTLDRVLGRRRG